MAGEGSFGLLALPVSSDIMALRIKDAAKPHVYREEKLL